MSLLDTASLIVTPNGYKEGTLYSVIPSDGSGDMSVVRATTATRVNSAGLVELVPYNLASYSEQFDNAYWSKYQVSITANNTTAPNGTLTADKLTNTLSAVASVYVGVSNLNVSTTHTLSVYFKKGTYNLMFLEAGGASYNFALFDINSGTVGTISGFSNVTITNVGDGWWRCVASFSDTNSTVTIGYGTAGSPTAGDITYMWGAQVVEGTLPKDYQKTETRLNIPRLDYSNGTCPSMLVEPQRTNYIWYSSYFDEAGAWGAIDTTITANTTISPSGNTDADTMAITSSTSRIFQTLALGAGTYTASIYVKSLSGTPTIQFRMVVDGSDITQSIPTTTDWVRHDFTFTASVAVSFFVIRGESGTGSVAIWGSQLEAGSYPTSYIPTTSASVTRNADVVSKTGISSLIGQTEGTIFVDFYNYGNNTNTSNVPFSISNGAYGDAVYFEQYLGNWYGIIFTGFTQQFAFNAGTLSIGRHKFAIAYKTNDIAFYADGNQLSTDTSATIPACSRVDIGTVGTSTTPEELSVNASALWKTRLTNTQLAQLTTI